MTSVIDAMYDDDDDVIETEEIETDDTDTDTDDTVADDGSDIDTDETETDSEDTDSEGDSSEGTGQIPEEVEPDSQGEKDVIPLATYIEMRKERNALKAQLEAAEKSVKQPETEDEDEDDGELITTAQARKIAQEMAVQAREEAQAAVRQEMFRSRLDASEEAARAELTAVKCGEGLDYDTVIATGKGSLSREDQQAILQSANPGKTAYQLCLERNPALKRLASLEQAARVAKTEPVKKVKTKTDPPPLKEIKDNPDVLGYLFDE